MTRRKVEKIRADHKGFTLVELLIAIAIFSIVVAAVCGFILVGSRSYASANSDITVQQEAQLALNQMSDVLIDTTRSVNYAGYNGAGSPTLVLKDSEFTFEPEAKSLVMYNGVAVEKASATPGGTPTTEIEEGNGNKHYQFYWSKSDETLYYTEIDVEPTDDKPENIKNRFPAFGAAGWVVLAEHVTKFEVDLTQVEEKRVVKLELTFVNGQREYNTSNNVTIRNKVGVNDVEIGPLDRSKTLSVVPKELSVILEPGETYHFSTPKVTGKNVTDKSVTWSIPSGYSGKCTFVDPVNGILQVPADEQAGDFNVVITTNAVDAEGRQAQATVAVQIKRVTTVTLGISGSSDTVVTSGSEFTVLATVGGNRLGATCNGCGDPTDKDLDVVDAGAYEWEVVEGAEYVTIEDAGVKSAVFKVASNAADGATIRIRATSYLSTVKAYDIVQGELVLTIKADEAAEPIRGMLQYGDETILNEIKEDLTTEGHEYVTCVRVVDNSTTNPEPDRILLYFTIGHGADFRIVPDLFDLDLNRSYTFYMQALDPVSKESHAAGNHHQADSKEQIWAEYISNVDNSKPYGYHGDRYDYRKVYYSVLEKPKAIWNYNGITYKDRDITYDPVNIYTVGLGSAIITDVEPVDFENIWHVDRTRNRMTYSVYVGDGDRSQWTPLYWFDGESMSYKGSTDVGGGVGKLQISDQPGRPSNPSCFFKLENGDRLKLCNDYHIVTGLCYDNISDRTLTGDYDFIGWQGFSCDGQSSFELPHKLRHYEFDTTIIHVNVNSTFTMDIDDDWFKGQVLFPLPKEMAQSVLFTNLQSADWQTTSGALYATALRDGSSNMESLEFTYVRYRYVPKNGTYEVEPFKVEYTGDHKVRTHSYGTYVCEENGTKWQIRERGYTVEKDIICNVKEFEYNGGSYQTYFPLPTESDFPFGVESGETYYTLAVYNESMQNMGNLSGVNVKCTKTGDSYEIQFIKKTKSNDGDNHKITVVIYGTYTWNPGQTEWAKKAGSEVTYETDLETNLEGLERDGKSYKMYFPLPTESDFPFTGTAAENTGNYLAWPTDDEYGEQPTTLYNNRVIYERTGDTYKLVFCNPWNEAVVYGIFQYQDGDTAWTKVP